MTERLVAGQLMQENVLSAAHADIAENLSLLSAENMALKTELGRLQQFVDDNQRVIVSENNALRTELGRLQEFVQTHQTAIVDENDALRNELGRLQEHIGKESLSIARAPQICFFHISKTAGTSIQEFLTSVVKGPIFQGDFDTASQRDLRNFSLVTGHMSYNHTRKLRRPYALITFLREPVDRVLSTYFYLRRSDPSLRLAAMSQQMSFRQFLECEDRDVVTFVRDHQTYALASDYRTHRSYDRRMVLSAAWTHLQEFAFVGFVEHFDVSMRRLSRILGVPFRRPPRTNMSQRPHPSALSQADLELARELNPLDCQLYKLAKEQFLPALLSRRRHAQLLLEYRNTLSHHHRNDSDRGTELTILEAP